jgi:hypothetical protein
MTTPRVLQKFVRRLYRNLFQSVPNGGLKEIDLSRLSPVHLRLEMPVGAQIAAQSVLTSNQLVMFSPEPWEGKN